MSRSGRGGAGAGGGGGLSAGCGKLAGRDGDDGAKEVH
jgi:hypothetical protein